MHLLNLALTTVTALAVWPQSKLSAKGPNGNNWLSFLQGSSQYSVIAGTRTGNELWLGWTASSGKGPANGFDFPNAHVRIVRVDLGTMKVLSEVQVWNLDYAFAYPSLAVNARGMSVSCLPGEARTTTPTLPPVSLGITSSGSRTGAIRRRQDGVTSRLYAELAATDPSSQVSRTTPKRTHHGLPATTSIRTTWFSGDSRQARSPTMPINSSSRGEMKTEQISELRLADAGCVLQNGVEHRIQLAGRRTDDTQHLGRRGLLFQGLL